MKEASSELLCLWLRPTKAAKRLDRSVAWLWQRLKTDPTFPKPVYQGPRAPVFSADQLDAWMRACASTNAGVAGTQVPRRPKGRQSSLCQVGQSKSSGAE